MVATRKRFTRSKPCPICGGFDSQQRGKDKRCYGFVSERGDYAHCTREEYSGGLPKHPKSQTYAHWLVDTCKCGTKHDPLPETPIMNSTTTQYDYTDEQGELLYQVCRAMPKKFFQRRPDGEGGWINNLQDVRRVLYRLPELLAADESATVFVCEGEKDVDALRKLGLVATTNSGGAGKWRYEYNETLKGRNVVVLPDNDEAGQEHAEQVARSLSGIAASVRIVKLPDLREKGDVSDWLNSGGTAEQLKEIVSRKTNHEARTVERQTAKIQSAAELLARDIPEPKYAVDGLLSEGVTIFAGKPKSGKSWLGWGLCIAVASGGRALGTIPVKQGDVLYLALEDGERRLQDRLGKILGNEPPPARLHLATEWKRLNEGCVEDLEDWLKAHPDTRLIVIDTLKRVRKKENTGKKQLYDVDYEAIEPLGDLGRKYGIGIIVIHHSRKQDSDDPLDLISGSFGLSGSADGALVLKRGRNQADAELHSVGRDFEEQALALRWDNAIYGWRLVGDAEEVYLTRERREVIDLIRLEGPKTPKEVAELLKRNHNSTRKLMPEMARDGQLVNDGTGRYSLPVQVNRGNSTNSSRVTHSGNSGNSDLDSATDKQSYQRVFPGNPVNGLKESMLDGRVTGVTIATNSKSGVPTPLFDSEGSIPKAGEREIVIPPEKVIKAPVEELFG